MSVSDATRDRIWRRYLDAELSVCYWNRLAHRYGFIDKSMKILLAVTSSSTIASWTLFSEYPFSWKLLSAVSALVAVCQPILKYADKLEKVSQVRGEWIQLAEEYEDLWDDHAELSDNQLRSALKRFRRREKQLSRTEGDLNFSDKRLRNACTEHVESIAQVKGGEG